jgi:hypothetical protein
MRFFISYKISHFAEIACKDRANAPLHQIPSRRYLAFNKILYYNGFL